MKLKRKDFVSVGVLLIIISICILSVFTVPAINNLYENFEVSRYENVKADIINGAKSKFSASINEMGDNETLEYTVKELIDGGYLKGTEINPLTGKPYNKEDKVLVISKNGNVTYKFINGTTLLKEIKLSSSVKAINNEFYYIGLNPNNYITFNEEIYRIIKVDTNNVVYIIKDKNDKKVTKDNIESYLNTYINDNFIQDKAAALGVSLLDTATYVNTKNSEDVSFLDSDNYFWLNDNNEIKVYDSLNKVFIPNIQKAWINPVIKLDNALVVEKGNGTRVNPYVVK